MMPCNEMLTNWLSWIISVWNSNLSVPVLEVQFFFPSATITLNQIKSNSGNHLEIERQSQVSSEWCTTMFYTSCQSWYHVFLWVHVVCLLLLPYLLKVASLLDWKTRTLFLHSFCIGLIVICALSKSLPVNISERQSLQTQRWITISILAMLLSENVWPREVSASNSTIRLKIIACADL